MKILDPNVFWTMITTAQPKILNTEYVFLCLLLWYVQNGIKLQKFTDGFCTVFTLSNRKFQSRGSVLGNTSVTPQKGNQN